MASYQKVWGCVSGGVTVSVWLLLELLNFLHISENTLTLTQNTILWQKKAAPWCAVSSSALLPFSVWASVSFSSLAASSAPSFLLVLRSCPRWLCSPSPFTLRRWLCSRSALLSPMSWKTHLSNTGSSSRCVSSSPVAKYERLWSKQVYSGSLLLIFLFFTAGECNSWSVGAMLTAS